MTRSTMTVSKVVVMTAAALAVYGLYPLREWWVGVSVRWLPEAASVPCQWAWESCAWPDRYALGTLGEWTIGVGAAAVMGWIALGWVMTALHGR